MQSAHHLNQRLSFASATCTIRYIGPVSGTPGEWLGVEWDDARRGKHSGEHGGIKYFKCKSPLPTAASFVRPNRPADPPLGFLDALHAKYVPDVLDDGDDGAAGSHVTTAAGATAAARPKAKAIEWGGKVVEEVGFDKVRRQQALVQELRIVLLAACCVAGVTGEGRAAVERGGRPAALERIALTCPNIVELDLSRNLLESWEEVVAICRQLRRLRSLRVSGNRFASLAACRSGEGDAEAPAAFDGVNELELDELLISWEELASIAASFPTLCTLSACSNDLVRLETPFSSETITKVVLEQNSFTSISDIAPLCQLPRLQRLHLAHNSINGSATGGVVGGSGLRFSPSVTYVDLSYNAIDHWTFIDRLSTHFPGLTDLRVAHNPLYEDRHGKAAKGLGIEESFMLTLARVPGLTSLDFSSISAPERTNAELYYLSRIGKELESVAVESDQAHVLQQHPRYPALCHLHGPPTVARRPAPGSINPNSLEARLIRFEFCLVRRAGSSSSSMPPETKVQKIPRSFDIYRVKGVVGRLFGVRPLSTRLVLETGEWETGEWDPVDRAEGEGEEEEEEEEEEEDEEGSKEGEGPEGGGKEGEDDDGTVKARHERPRRGRWVRRELELPDSTRTVDFWIEGREAKVRVELR
ncbi:MAG: hypothetical protein M1826_006962 [Phylliscum demangeonii]|nr:MAG: hypothetical protein M1826_006962 [Phylliscum demangeonii]